MSLPASYSASLFVTPREVGQLVHAKIKNWKELHASNGTRAQIVGLRSSSIIPPGDLVLALVGERGVGKTWLLRHLEARQQPAPHAVYLDLESRVAYATAQDYVRDVEDRIACACGDRAVLLLLDHVPPHLDEQLRMLEDVVLRPHLAHHRSLVIMALVHPTQVCWRAPVLRGGETLFMPRFNQMQTRLQWRCLERAGLAQPSLMSGDLWRLSDGLPLLNYLLATWPRIDAFELLLGYWLGRVPVAERGVVRGCLEAVCQLEFLEFAAIERMLDIYDRYHDQPAEHPIHAGGVPNLLRKYWLAQPARNAPVELCSSTVCSARRVR